MSDSVKTQLNMADRRKAIKSLYSNDDGLRIRINKSPFGTAATYFTEETLERAIQQITSKSASIDDILRLGNYAYATEPNFAEMVNYLANMYLWRYYYIPVKIKEKANDSVYEEIYNLMTEVIDGLSIETTFPTILVKLLKEGAVYLYAVKDSSSRTISTLMLNPKYCSPVMMSQFGTGVYQFDVKYFDSFGVTGQVLDAVLELYPDELVSAYKTYKASPTVLNQFVVLDGRFATYIQLNEFNFPTTLTVLRSLFDYNTYRKNEVERSTSQLDQILTHKIPAYEDQLLFELPEVQDLHASMAKILSGNTRLKLLTTFGETDIKPIQPQSNIQNEVLEKAYKAIYQNSGLNVELFNGKTTESLLYSTMRDASIMWRYIQQLINFYNLTINNLFNFKGFQIELNMIPITHYNQEKEMELYRKNSEYGVGKLELIVASGTKQRHIHAKADLEDFLKLDEILKPLSSSHTTPGTTENKKTTDEEVKKPKVEEETE